MSTNDKPTSRQSARSKGKATRVAAPPPKRSPVLLATIGAIVAGAIIVVILVLANGSPGGNSSTALATPAFQTPAELADGRSLGVGRRAHRPSMSGRTSSARTAPGSREQIEPLLVPLYVQPGQARLTFHDLAFIGPESTRRGRGGAGRRRLADQFWAYHDLLFANQHGENSGRLQPQRASPTWRSPSASTGRRS